MHQVSPTFQNHLLAMLPREDIHLLLPHLQPVDLKQRQILYNVGDSYNYIYFIESAVISVLTVTEDGSSIEVGMIGKEGITPIGGLLSDDPSQQNVTVQLAGTAYRLSTANCKAAFEASPTIRKAILQFTNAFLNLSAQNAACNRLHSVEQRVARWLLMSSDRFESDILPLTQEYIASMLGVRRVGVTEAAGELQRAGLIRYNHGNITILDRDGMEKIACECYCVHFDQLNRPVT